MKIKDTISGLNQVYSTRKSAKPHQLQENSKVSFGTVVVKVPFNDRTMSWVPHNMLWIWDDKMSILASKFGKDNIISSTKQKFWSIRDFASFFVTLNAIKPEIEKIWAYDLRKLGFKIEIKPFIPLNSGQSVNRITVVPETQIIPPTISKKLLPPYQSDLSSFV